MQNILLSPEIQCHPTWLEAGSGRENISPGELPISPDLVTALEEWRDRWDATYDLSDPASAGFSSDEEEARFLREGEVLAKRLTSELGADWKVSVDI